MDTKKSPLKRLLFLFLPFIFLFVYDILVSLVSVVIERGLTLFSVSDKFLSSSASFMDASIAFVLSIICYIFYRTVFTKREPEVRISKPTGVIYAIILGFGAGGISSLWLNGVYILLIITGVMFGIWHGSFIQGVYTAIFGMILAYFMKKCRSLVFVAFAHGINNLSGTLPPSLDTDFTNTLLNVTSYVCILPTLAILYHLHRKSKKITN